MPPAAKPMRRRLPQAHMAGDAERRVPGQAKARAKRAYYACRADPRLAPIGDRVWAETLQHAEGQDPVRAEAMFLRVAVLLEILIDRRGWPGTIRGFG
jgi:hypothetical protein